MSPDQCRAARAWLNLSREDLAWSAKVSVDSVKQFEQRHLSRLSEPVAAMQRVLEGRGVKFLDKDGFVVSDEGIVVRKRNRRRANVGAKSNMESAKA